MTDTARPATRPERRLLDWMLAVLAWVSLVVAGWLLWFTPADELRDRVLVADLAISGVFALAICLRWLRFRIGWVYLRKHWWEVLAVVPLLAVADWRFLGYVVLAARVMRVVDRTDSVAGDRITAWLVRHFSEPIVSAIKRPITVAVLDEVIDVIRTGDYATNVSHALDENRVELETLILDLVKQDQLTRRIKYVPFHDELVRSVTDSVFRIIHGALEDPRVHELISDAIRNSATQLRQSVRLGVHTPTSD